MEFTMQYDNSYIRRFEQIISTQNDNSNSSNNSISTLCSGSKKKRTPLSTEQREMINAKRRISALTPEQRERRNSKRRITSLTPEQRERVNSKRRVSSLTIEQREQRNVKRRVSSLTPEQREKRNMKRRISSMTTEQRAVVNSKRRRNTSNINLLAATQQSQLQLQPQSLQQQQQQQQQTDLQQQLQGQFITTVHLDHSKKGSDTHFTPAMLMDSSQLGSYDLFRQKIVHQCTTPQEVESVLNSLARNNSLNTTIININRRC